MAASLFTRHAAYQQNMLASVQRRPQLRPSRRGGLQSSGGRFREENWEEIDRDHGSS